MDAEAEAKRRFQEDFGKQLEKLIYRKFKSKEAFLQETGIFKATLHDILKGKVDPQLFTLKKIADGLHVPLSDLFKSL